MTHDDTYMLLMVVLELHNMGVSSDDCITMAMKSTFLKMLKSDPVYVCHYEPAYWASNIATENGLSGLSDREQLFADIEKRTREGTISPGDAKFLVSELQRAWGTIQNHAHIDVELKVTKRLLEESRSREHMIINALKKVDQPLDTVQSSKLIWEMRDVVKGMEDGMIQK